MKRKFAVLTLVLAVFLSVGYVNRAQAQEASVDIGVFYDSLAPYGPWIEYGEYGYAWQPAEVGPEWRPYRDGEWTWSQAGWTWISPEPWGWATYHYGRWTFDDYYGWLWIPGPTWAPAYVSWYQSPDYIGWAPLPPDNYFSLEIGYYFGNWALGFSYGAGGYGYGGYGIGFNYAYYGGYKKHHRHHHRKRHKRHYHNHQDYYAPSHHTTFVNTEHFGHKNAKLVAIADAHNYTVVNKSRNITNIKVQNNNYINYGPDRGYINQKTRGKLKRVELVDRDVTVNRGSRRVNRVKGDKYNVYRPNVRNSGKRPSRLQANRDINKNHQRQEFTNTTNANIKSKNKYGGRNFNNSNPPDYKNKKGAYSSRAKSPTINRENKFRERSNLINAGRRKISSDYNNNSGNRPDKYKKPAPNSFNQERSYTNRSESPGKPQARVVPKTSGRYSNKPPRHAQKKGFDQSTRARNSYAQTTKQQPKSVQPSSQRSARGSKYKPPGKYNNTAKQEKHKSSRSKRSYSGGGKNKSPNSTQSSSAKPSYPSKSSYSGNKSYSSGSFKSRSFGTSGRSKSFGRSRGMRSSGGSGKMAKSSRRW